MTIQKIYIEFDLEPGQDREHPACDYGKSIRIHQTPPVCQSCGQDHKANIELDIWQSPNGPNQKTRHETFADAYNEARKQFPELP